MKSYTDLEQSKKLSEILPLESADMKWFTPADDESEFVEEVSLINDKSEYYLFEKVTDWNDTPYIPCWSLAALLDYLSANFRTDIKYLDNYWELDCRVQVIYNKKLVDACGDMIIKLHEQNLL